MRGQQQVVELRLRGEGRTGAAEVFGDLLGQQPQLDVCFLDNHFSRLKAALSLML